MSENQFAILISNVSKTVDIQNEENLNAIEKLKNFFLNKQSKQFNILKNINLEVPKLKTLGIIGKNGSGKSSLLKLIANITSPSEGFIQCRGKVAAILDIGSGFHPELTGEENIQFYGKILGMSQKEIAKKKNIIIEFSELAEFINRPVKHYSNGMYLRLAFSIAVHSDVDIILFDEILTVGDASFNIKCFQKINEIKKRTNIVLVSHSLEDITRVCDICVWLDNGEMKSVGNPHEIVSQYIVSSIEKDKKLQDYFNINHEINFQPILQNNTTLSDFYILNSSKTKTKIIDYTEEFSLNFSVKIDKEKFKTLIPTIQIIDQNNNSILITDSVYQGEPYTYFSTNGKYQTICNFPARFLNKGVYSVNFFLIDFNQEVHLESINTIIFKVKIDDQNLNEHMKKTSISLSPGLDWSIIKSI